MLSGFVMIIAYGKASKLSTSAYLRNRLARIYPVYFLALMLFVIPVVLAKSSIDLKDLLLNLTLTQSWIPGKAMVLNGPGWSLSVELFFYALFPFLFNKIYSKYSLKNILIPILIVFIASQLLLHFLVHSDFYQGYPSASHDFIYYFPPMHLNEFLLGNIAGLFFLKNKKTKNYDIPILIVFFILIIVMSFETGLNYHNGLLALVFVPLIVLISLNNGFLTVVSNLKPLVFLGKISYGVYILQLPVYRIVNYTFNTLEIHDESLKFYAFLIILIIASSLSYQFIENPIRNALRKKI